MGSWGKVGCGPWVGLYVFTPHQPLCYLHLLRAAMGALLWGTPNLPANQKEGNHSPSLGGAGRADQSSACPPPPSLVRGGCGTQQGLVSSSEDIGFTQDGRLLGLFLLPSPDVSQLFQSSGFRKSESGGAYRPVPLPHPPPTPRHSLPSKSQLRCGACVCVCVC